MGASSRVRGQEEKNGFESHVEQPSFRTDEEKNSPGNVYCKPFNTEINLNPLNGFRD
jgi:hypothetical protein